MVAFGRKENLRLVFEPTESLTMYYAVSVARKLGARHRWLDRLESAARLFGFLRVRRQKRVFYLVYYVRVLRQIENLPK
jgi:hypothetical protein